MSEAQGNTRIPFGKSSGQHVVDLPPDYIKWLATGAVRKRYPAVWLACPPLAIEYLQDELDKQRELEALM